MKAYFTAAVTAAFVLGATSVALAQATTADQNSGVDARSHPSTTTSTQSSTQSGADLGTGMSPANNNPSMTGHDNSGMRTDAGSGTSMHSSTTHRRHRTSHTTTSTSGSATGDQKDSSGTPQ
jgi:hypothetical protein